MGEVPVKEPWHINKGVTLSTIMGVVVLLGSQIYQYGMLNEKITNLESAVEQIRTTHVPKDVVDQMMIVRDVQIVELKEDVKENQALLREVLQRLPSGD